MPAHRLKIHSYPATIAAAKHPPLLFVHGAYTDSRLWLAHFIPFFTAHGYACYAVDLSGHGDSAGRERLNDFGLDDYAADLAEAVARLPAPPVLIGHSMGCVVIQRFLETGSAPGVAFLAPVPPTGTAGSASRLALAEPGFFAELPKVVAGHGTEHSLKVMARVYFSPDMAAAEVLQCLPMIQPESDRAVMEMVGLPFHRPGRRPNIPAVVIGGERDAVFPVSMQFFTALAWRAESVSIPRAGHMLMLDPQWPAAAAALADWLASL